MRKTKIVALGITVVIVGALYTRADESTNKTSVSVEVVQKGIVGVWNGVWDEPNMHMSSVMSFDAQGRITEDGFFGEMGICGRGENREGKVKYRLEQRKDGPGVNLIEIEADGKERSTHIIEGIAEDKLSMRGINSQTKEPMQLVDWKRIKKEPYPVKEQKKGEKKSE